MAIATLRYQFCDMTSFKYGGWRLWERWRSEPTIKEFPIWGQGFGCLDTGELQAFNQPANQSDNQTSNQPTGHSVRRPNFQTQHALANRSGIFHLRPCWVSGATVDKTASLMTTGRRKQRYILVVRPARLPQVLELSALAPARLSRDPLGLIPPPLRSGGFWSLLFSSLLGRQEDRGKAGEVGRLASSRPLTGSYSTGQE